MPKTAPKKILAKASTNRLQLGLTITQDTLDRLTWLCGRKSAEYAARGLERSASRLQSEVVSELIFGACDDSQKNPRIILDSGGH